MIPLQPRANFNSRLLLLAVVLSVLLHGLAIVGTPRWGAIDDEPPPEPPLEVELIAPPPQAPPRVAEPPAPAPQAIKTKREPQPRTASVFRKTVPVPAASTSAEKNDVPAVVREALPGEQDAIAQSSPPAPAAVQPYPLARARLVFDLYYGDSLTLVGEVEQRFERDGERYVATSVAEAVGFVGLFLGGRHVQRSEGRIGPQGLVPERYSVQERKAREPEHAIYDWANGVVRFERKGRVRETPLKPGAQDVLSAVHQLHYLQPFEPGWHMEVATSRKLESMLFMNMGYEEVETALGSTLAVHIRREDLDGDLTEVWLDPQRYFLPVRVYNRNRHGHVLVQILREASFERAEHSGGA